ncbi:LLM class flavin-dependent oxidoreductase [Streptomyces sp. DT2A-34]|uniref:LLM class flavin-dependent oxidoreductase n=1 Tax=Streptomyces sp. DT2A-34 TaxID=3051182 RepID=UPI00265BFCCE|nr:LLM class flavin-dependent oxidoreductase [Streptomyces sp. DT2A-34]MDO0916657.1 LLM class flavin-dependent oxidoreductase [Streptomyces sp. DT2A-34]
MKFGIFNAPYADPASPLQDVIEWSLQVARWGDELGFEEIWFAEHYTTGWQNSPAPELLIAAAARETTNITLAAGAHLVPYQHPVALAYRIMALDHLTGGRYIAGVGAGSYPADVRLFQTDGNNAEMLTEGLDIMTRIWAGEPFEFRGKYWAVEFPAYDEYFAGPALRPLQSPHPPIAIAGSSAKSKGFQTAGERGFLPLSFGMSAAHLRSQWEGYAEAAKNSGRQVSRDDWRVCREVFVAETDEEAIDLVTNGFMGRFYDEFMIMAYQYSSGTSLAPGVPMEDVTAELLARDVWLVGSPETVAQRITAEYEESGGFGTLVAFDFDYRDKPDAYRRSLELLMTEVAPKVAHLEKGQA